MFPPAPALSILSLARCIFLPKVKSRQQHVSRQLSQQPRHPRTVLLGEDRLRCKSTGEERIRHDRVHEDRRRWWTVNNPRCDYVPMWSNIEHQCGKEALIRVLRTGSTTPDYKERCLPHADLGRHEVRVIAFRSPDATGWIAAH